MSMLESKHKQSYIPIQTTVQKWGNSQGIRLPKSIIDAIDLKENDFVNIELSGTSIVINKATKKYKNLQERLESYYNRPIDEIHKIEHTEEIEIEPIGEEIW